MGALFVLLMAPPTCCRRVATTAWQMLRSCVSRGQQAGSDHGVLLGPHPLAVDIKTSLLSFWSSRRSSSRLTDLSQTGQKSFDHHVCVPQISLLESFEIDSQVLNRRAAMRRCKGLVFSLIDRTSAAACTCASVFTAQKYDRLSTTRAGP